VRAGGRGRRVRPRLQDIRPAGPTDFQPAFAGRSQAPPPRAVVVTESPLLLRCLEETDRHAQEIEELENRTALHIDYAQEKQIEIKVLENFLEETRNQSHLNEKKREVLEASVQNMTNIIKRKDDKIRGLKDDKKKVEATLRSEIKMKQQNIEGLNKQLDNASTELSNMKATLKEQTEEVSTIFGRLEKVKATVKRLNVEKKNLLQIVQALAEIGNPALNFSKFLQNDEEAGGDNDGGEALEEEEGSAEYDYEYSGASGEGDTSEEGSATASTPNSSEI
jgi:myosin heavy subunit